MTNAYRILAADIGGTNSRFADVEIRNLAEISFPTPVVFPTWSESIDSFVHLLEHYSAVRPPGSPGIEEYDALAIGLAGAISVKRATLPNIPWDIDLTASQPAEHIFLLNDFFAQAHAYLDPHIFNRLHVVRSGPGSGPGSIAVVGAGTGLGHAALKPADGGRVVIGSEAGHTSFSFHGKEEREIETSLLARSGKAWLSGDDILSGSGAAMIHEILTGNAMNPAEALAKRENESATCAWFSRFYARACRNYCLAMHPVEALIITGGIAARNPHIVESDSFIAEFTDGRSYRQLLERIPIYLNRDDELGMRGAAIHAWIQLLG